MMARNGAALRTVALVGSIWLLAGLIHADDKAKQEAPTDDTAKKEVPAGGEAKKETPAGGEAKKETPTDDKVKKEVPAGGEAKKETPTDDKAKKEVPAGGEAKKETPADDKEKKETPADDKEKKESSADDKEKKESSAAGKAKKETPTNDKAKKEVPAGGEAKKETPADDKEKKESSAAGKAKKEAPTDDKAKKEAPAESIEIFYTWLEPTGVPGDKSTVLMAFRSPAGSLKVFWWIPQEDNLSQIDEVLREPLYSQFPDKDARQHSFNTLQKALRAQKTQQALLAGPLYRVSIQHVAEARPKASVRANELMTAWNNLFVQNTRQLSILRVETKDFGQVKIAATRNFLLVKRATSGSGDAGSSLVIDLEASAVELLAAMAGREKTLTMAMDLRYLTEWDVEGDCPVLKERLTRLLSQPVSLQGIPRRRAFLPIILGTGTASAALVPNPVRVNSQWTLSNRSLKEVNLAEVLFKDQDSGAPVRLLQGASIPGCGQVQLSVFYSDGNNQKIFSNDWGFLIDPQRINPRAWRVVITRKESGPWIAASRASVVNGEIEVELERIGVRYIFGKVKGLAASFVWAVVPWLWVVGLVFGSVAVLLGLVWSGRASWHRWRRQTPEPLFERPGAASTADDRDGSEVEALPVEVAKSEAEAPVESGGETRRPQESPASATEAEPQQPMEVRQQIESLREERDRIKQELREKEDRYVSAAGESTRLRRELTDLKERFTSQKDEIKTKTEQIRVQRRDLEAKDKKLTDAQSEAKRLSTEITKITSALEKQKSDNAKLQKSEKELSEKAKAWQAALQGIGRNPEEIAERWNRETGWLKTVTEGLQSFFQAAVAKEAISALKERSPERLGETLETLGAEVHEGRTLVEEILRDLADEHGADNLIRRVSETNAGELRRAYRKLQQQRAAIDRIRKLNPRIANVIWVVEGMRQLTESLARMAADSGARLLTGTLLEPAPLATALQAIAEKSEDRWNEMLRTVAGSERGSAVAVSRAFGDFLDWFLDGERLQTLTNILRLAQVIKVYCEGASDPEIAEFYNRSLGYCDECEELQKRFDWIGVQLAPIAFFKPPQAGDGWAFHENGDGHPLIFESYALKKLAVNKAMAAGGDVTRAVSDVSTWGFHCDIYKDLRSDTRGWLCRGWRTL